MNIYPHTYNKNSINTSRLQRKKIQSHSALCPRRKHRHNQANTSSDIRAYKTHTKQKLINETENKQQQQQSQLAMMTADRTHFTLEIDYSRIKQDRENQWRQQELEQNARASPSKILPDLFVGSESHTDLETLSRLNITHILSLQWLPIFLRSNSQPILSATNPAVVFQYESLLPPKNSSRDYIVRLANGRRNVIRGKLINIVDEPGQALDRFFQESIQFIEEARRNKCNVLVHCQAGISRAPSIVIAYLMRSKQLGFRKAFKTVQKRRIIIDPNFGFCFQLMEYEKKLRSEGNLLK